ncbi:MAG: cell division protein FtsL [Thermodesulfobacteriota bacterium]|nr:cell division protein FtsL [Thermodesulfobacteriota bacterium]
MARPNRKKNRRTGVWIVLLIICLAELLGYTWFRVQHVRTGYEIGQLTGENRRLKEQQNILRAELARLKSPARLARIAGKLGLKRPEPTQIRSLP